MTDLLVGPPLNLNGLAQRVHAVNVANGWYENGIPPIPEQIALIHSEASEMLEANRNNRTVRKGAASMLLDVDENDVFKAAFKTTLKDTLEQELADVIIRCLDFAAARNININDHVLAGIRFNSLRGHKHGGKAY